MYKSQWFCVYFVSPAWKYQPCYVSHSSLCCYLIGCHMNFQCSLPVKVKVNIFISSGARRVPVPQAAQPSSQSEQCSKSNRSKQTTETPVTVPTAVDVYSATVLNTASKVQAAAVASTVNYETAALSATPPTSYAPHEAQLDISAKVTATASNKRPADGTLPAASVMHEAHRTALDDVTAETTASGRGPAVMPCGRSKGGKDHALATNFHSCIPNYNSQSTSACKQSKNEDQGLSIPTI